MRHPDSLEGRGNGFALLGQCLGLQFGTQRLTATRMQLYANSKLWGPLLEMAVAAGLGPAFEATVTGVGLMPASQTWQAASGLGQALSSIRAAHLARRDQMRERLNEIVEAMGRKGMEPLLLKGAASLWTGRPSWRAMRDLDVLVPQEVAEDAQALLGELGYRQAPDAERRPHHLETMTRDDLPGWIELHTSPSNPRGERLLPSESLLRHSSRSTRREQGLSVRLLHPAHQALHGLVHHHFANRGAAYGVIALKGLFEFAFGLSQLDADGVEVLRQTARRCARLAAAVDLWTAAASDLFGLEPGGMLQPAADAALRWRSIRRRIESGEPCSLIDALREDARMSLAPHRLANAVAAGSHANRLGAALHSLRSFLGETPSTPSGRAAARQRATGLTAITA